MPYPKINLKWIKDLNVRQESIKILEENTDSNLFNLSHSNFLQDTSLKERETKAKINYWDYNKTKQNRKKNHFCTAKETINKTKRQPTEWEKIFANDMSDKGLIFKIYKELLKPNTQKPNNPVKEWAEAMNRHFAKDIQKTDT